MKVMSRKQGQLCSGEVLAALLSHCHDFLGHLNGAVVNLM